MTEEVKTKRVRGKGKNNLPEEEVKRRLKLRLKKYYLKRKEEDPEYSEIHRLKSIEYYNELRKDPERYKARLESSRNRSNSRYRNDEEYREKVKERNREYYRIRHPESKKCV